MASRRPTSRGKNEVCAPDRVAGAGKGAGGSAWIGLAVCAIALLARLAYLHDSSDNPTFLAPTVDSQTYDALARDLVAGKGMAEAFFWQPVFYPLFLSIVYYFSDCSIPAAKLVQALVGSLTCLLAYRLGCKLGNRATGLLAGIITALYGPLIFIEGELLGEGWAAFWAVALVLVLLRLREAKTGFRNYITLGLCGVLAVLTRPTFLPFFVAACLWLAVTLHRSRIGWGPVAARLALVAAGFAVLAIPVAIQKQRVVGSFGILPDSGGLNFYIGNNPASDRVITIRPGMDWAELTLLPDQEGIYDPQAKAGYYYSLVRKYAADDPAGFARGLLDKTVQFLSSREIPRNLSIYLFRRWSGILSLLTWKIGDFGFPFGVLLPLAVLGVVLHGRRIPAPVILLLALHALSVILVFVSGRYRLPIIPVVAVPAAWGCLALVDMIRTRRWGRAAGAAAVMAAIAAAISLPGPFPAERQNYEAEMHYNLGCFFRERQADKTRAAEEFRRATELNPQYVQAFYNSGTTNDEMGNYAEAIRDYDKAIALRSNYAKAYMNRGNTRYRLREYEEALADYDKAIELKPNWGLAYCNRGAAWHKLGRYAEAVEDYTRSIQLMPDYADAYQNRARSYCSLKEYAKAWADVEKCGQLGGRLDPEFLTTLTQASSRPE